MTTPIPLAEQIAAVERAAEQARFNYQRVKQEDFGVTVQCAAMKEAQRMAAALATLRGLLLIEETR